LSWRTIAEIYARALGVAGQLFAGRLDTLFPQGADGQNYEIFNRVKRGHDREMARFAEDDFSTD